MSENSPTPPTSPTSQEHTHSPATHWWTASGLSPRAKLGTAVVASLLLVVTVAVWTSPSGPDSAEAATSPTVSAEEQRLADELARVQGRLDARETELADLKAAQEKAAAERAAGQASGQAKAEAERAAADAESQAKAAAEREAAAARGRARAAAERDAATARGQAATAQGSSAQSRAEEAEAEAEAARQAAAAAQKRADAAAEQAKPPAPQPPTKPTAPTLAELVDPSERQFGLYTPQSPFSWAELDDVVAKVGHRPTIAGYFQGWDGDFRPDAVTRSWERGMMPLLTWESRPMKAGNDQAEDPDYSLPVIIGDPENGVPGRYDEYLRQYARDIVALGLPLAIRLDHEMNGSWYPWGERAWGGNPLNGNRKGDFVTMWRHVHDIFEAEGAGEYVLWVWAPNIVNSLPAYAKNSSWYMSSLYPGDEYVDWVGLSGYYRPPYRADQTPTFQYTFDRSLDQLREVAPGKPILLAEIGASEVGGKKPAWVTSLFDSLAEPEYDDVVGFAWFHHTVTTISGGERVTNDWRITSRRDSLEAFVAGMDDPATGFGPATTASATEVQPTPGPTSTAPPAEEPAFVDPSPDRAGPDAGESTPSPTATATPTPTPSGTPEPSPTPTPTPSGTTPPPAPEPEPTPGSSP